MFVKEKLTPKKGLDAVADSLEKFIPVLFPMTGILILISAGASLLNRNSDYYSSSGYDYSSRDRNGLDLNKNRSSNYYSDSSIISSNYSSSSHSYSGHSSSNDYSSSSSSSSSDWGGGGFDGGGASGGW